MILLPQRYYFAAMTNQNQKAVHSEYCDTLQGGQTWRCRTPNGAGFEGQRAPCFCQNDPGVEEEGDSKEGKPPLEKSFTASWGPLAKQLKQQLP